MFSKSSKQSYEFRDIPIITEIAKSSDDGKPLSFDNKTEIFKVFKSIAENTVNSLKN